MLIAIRFTIVAIMVPKCWWFMLVDGVVDWLQDFDPYPYGSVAQGNHMVGVP